MSSKALSKKLSEFFAFITTLWLRSEENTIAAFMTHRTCAGKKIMVI